MKKLMAVIAALLILVGCTLLQNAADGIQRNFQATAIRVRAIAER